jgi:hypothetical protein
VSILSRALERWFRRPRPRGRLDAAQALEIARRAAVGEPDADLLAVATLDEDTGRPTWLVSAPVVGSTLVVSIDDETSQVVDVKRYGVR